MLTDTLRKYIVDRFGIKCDGNDFGEILEFIHSESEAKSVYDSLKQILELSDFVKFAKLHPLPNENEISLMNAYLFVNQTKIIELAKSDESKESTEIKE